MNLKSNFPKFLKVAVIKAMYQIEPWALKSYGNATMYVVNAQLITLFSELLDFDYKVVTPLDGPYGDQLPDGNWTGVVGLAHREEADIAIGKLSFTAERATVVDFTYPYQYCPITFITDKPEYSPDSLAFLRPFAPFSWIAIVTSLILVQFLSYIFKTLNKHSENLVLKVYGSLLEKSVDFKLRTLSTKCLIWPWIIAAMLLAQFYKADLLSFLTFPSLVGIRDIAQLSKASEKSSFKCSAYRGSNLYDDALNSGGQSWKNIKKCLIRSDIYVKDIEEFLQSSIYKKAFLGSKSHLQTLHKNYFISDDSFFTDTYSIAVRKTFCCKSSLDKAIHRMTAGGFFNKLDRDEQFFFALSKTHSGDRNLSRSKKLSLEELLSAFIILLLGYILASIALIVEILFCRKQK